jgi:glycosyltransferase involved in cell wall biosynthesis
MLNLAQGIAKRNINVDLVLVRAAGPYLNQVPKSVRLINLNASRALLCLPALVRYLRSERPQALLSALNYTNIIALWARRLAGTPNRVVVVEQNTFSYWNRQAKGVISWIMPQVLKRFYPWSDAIVAVSRGTADDLSKVTSISREQIQILYNPIITLELQEKKCEIPDHSWFRAEHLPVLIAVGRLTQQKDFSTLIRAFAQVRQTHDVRLMILGEGEERSALMTLIRSLRLEDSVTLPGFVTNPYSYMSHASLCILSSKFEGLPTVLVEYLFCGTAIIATDCPGGSREILRDGQYGVLVPVGDVKALVQAINRALEGGILCPPPQSWHPYKLDLVVDQYLELLSLADHA